MLDEIEKIFVNQVVDGEYTVSKANQDGDRNDFESYIDLLSSERDAKDYDWMSDIRIPEFASHVLTQSSLDVAQYFTTRDFVEVYLEDEGDEALMKAEASKECLNRTLNRRDLYHYQKFVRGKTINNLVGKVYLKCWWEQDIEEVFMGREIIEEELDVDVLGRPLLSDEQVPATREVEGEELFDEVVMKDQFQYDIYDERNVFTDNTYTYSIQDKQFVIFRDEVTLNDLEIDKAANGYFNLDKIDEQKEPDGYTETASETYNKDDNFNPVTSSIPKKFDRLERYGKFWTVFDNDGNAKPGIDEEGKRKENSHFVEVIATIIVNGSTRTLIGYKMTPYIDAMGFPYRPVIRGLCYIHPTEDGGIGDGEYTRELQIAIDDTFNISQDRVMLATLPTLKVNKNSLIDNSSLYFEPGHHMEVEQNDDINEFMISDNIVGALNQIGMLTTKMQQVDAIQPPSMGQTPSVASTTATAASLADQGTDTRTNYKSLSFENTALTELYWMILQMTWQFAKPETGFKLMGEKVYNFDPSKEYFYKPLSQSIETEYSKANKRREWATILGYVVQLQHPDAPKLINTVLGEITKLMGDEFVNFRNMALNEQIPIQQTGGEQPGASANLQASNQNGLPMSGAETNVRGL